MRKLLACLRAILLGLILASGSATAALAHAQLLGTVPAQDAVAAAAPDQAQLVFNEPVTAIAVGLVDPDGTRTDLLGVTSSGEIVQVTLPAGLAAGTHVLSWRVVSVDAHPIAGSLIFSVGQPTGNAAVVAEPDPLVATAIWTGKAVLYACLLLGVGGAVFSIAAPLPAGVKRMAIGLSGAGLFLAPLTLGLNGLDALGLPPGGLFGAEPWQIGASTTYGPTVLVLELAFVTAIAALALRRLRVLAAIAGLLAAFAPTLSGHAGAAEPQWLTRSAVFLHIAGLLFWIGALPPLLVYLRDHGDGAERALRQFSRFIPIAVAPILISGAALGAVQLGVPSAHWLSPYAAILATKLLLVAALLGLGLWNRLRLTTPTLAGETRARGRLRLSVRAEIVLALLILALVAGWRFTPPPRALAQVASVTEASPIHAHLMDDGMMVMATIDPGRTGRVTLSVVVTDLSGAPLQPEAMGVTLSAPDLGIEPFRLDATSKDGAWLVEDLAIPLRGSWRLELDLRMSRFSLVSLKSNIAIP
jgi:copper transport protein